MRAVFWKEWREMVAVTVALVVLGAFLGLPLELFSRVAIPLFAIHGSLGFVVGVAQAFLDRNAMGDAFLRHRPVETWRIHAARSAVGLTIVVLASIVSLSVSLRAPLEVRVVSVGVDTTAQWHRWKDWSPAVGAFAVVFAVAVWATVRLGASMGRRTASIILAAVFPAFLTLSLTGTATNAGATAVAVATACVAMWLVVLRQASGIAAGGSR